MKSYPDYRPTGLPWLPQIPAHWEQRKVGNLFRERVEKVADTDYAPLSVTKNGIVPQLENAAKTDAGDNRKRVCLGDFVINSRSDRKGSCGISNLSGSVSLVNIVLEPGDTLTSAYVHYLLRCHAFSEEFYRNGHGIVADLWTTRYREMKTIGLPVPSREEQAQIVRFLDKEVAQIDQLIAVKQQQIELLEERKSAIIDSELTSTSGDWETKPLKWYVTNNDEVLSETTPDDYSFEYIDIGSVGFRQLKTFPEKLVFANAPSRARKVVREGDTILSTVRTYLKAILYIDAQLAGKIVSTGFAVLRPKTGVYPQLLSYVLSGSTFIETVIRKSVGVSYPAISDTKLLAIKVRLPRTIESQRALYSKILRLTQSTDDAIAKGTQMIHCLQELKARLISDVVTGAVDVRGKEA